MNLYAQTNEPKVITNTNKQTHKKLRKKNNKKNRNHIFKRYSLNPKLKTKEQNNKNNK